MNARGRVTVIDLDHERLSFVSGTVSSGRVRIACRRSTPRPPNLDASSADAFGAWLGEQLSQAGMGSPGKVLVCVPRGNVVMKRLSFPGLETGDPDLVAMVRLQMTRQMPMRVEGTTIDFVPLVRAEQALAAVGAPTGSGSAGSMLAGESSANEGPGVEVLACALPGDRVTWCRGVVEAAGLKLASLSLRASGSATLAAQAGHGTEAAVLTVSMGWSSVEFVVVRSGAVVFVRSADIPLTEDADPAGFADRVAVEAKRTWMAYRVSPGSSDIASVAVVGSGPIARAVAERCADSLAVASSVVELPGFVEDESSQAVEETGTASPSSPAGEVALAPLIGLMVAHASDQPVFDFAHPREAPDTRASTRRLALLGVLGAILIIGGGIVVADMQVRKVERAAAKAQDEAQLWGRRLQEHLRADARVRHLEQWLAADVDWVSHWTKISQTMPAPPEALLDSLDGTLTARVTFQPEGSSGTRRYDKDGWGLDLQASLHTTGQIQSRIVGNQFRARLVADPTYTVESRGADTETRFDMDLLTRSPAPVAPAASQAGTPAARADGDQPATEPKTQTAAADAGQGVTP